MPQRILLYGVTGSGKSTAATEVARRTGLPLFLADELTWLPGWVQVSEEEQRRRFTAIAAGEQWVLDTAYSAWLDVVEPRAHLIVCLDYPRWLSLGRLLRRSFARARDQQPVCNGNTETWRQLVSRESIVLWHFRSFADKKAQVRAWARAASGPADRSPGPQVLVLRHPRELAAWLETLRPERGAAG